MAGPEDQARSNEQGRHPTEDEVQNNLVEVETPQRRRRCLVLTVVVVLCFIVIGGGISVPSVLPLIKQSDFSRSGFNDSTQLPATPESTPDPPTRPTETVTSYSWSEWSPWSPCIACAVQLSTRERVCEERRGTARLSRQECDGRVSSQETRTCPLMSNCTDCAEIHSTLRRADNGTYLIDPDGKGPFRVYCDMTTDGGGWTVFQRRQDGSQDFNRTWDEYKTGFGNLSGEFWLGNEYIHRLTHERNKTLRIDMGEKVFYYHYYAIYDNFSIGSERENYILHIGSYRGGHTDSLLGYENGKMFSTFDRDNDGHSDNLAASIGGGWWYPSWYSFYVRSPNGLYKRKFGWYYSGFRAITHCDFKIK